MSKKYTGPEHHNGCTIHYGIENGKYRAIIRWPDGVLPAAGASWLNTRTDDLDAAREIATTFIDIQLRDTEQLKAHFAAAAK